MLIWQPKCVVGVAFRKPLWRSWQVRFCHGYQFTPDGKEKHFYHFPKFYHNDVAKLLEAHPVVIPANLTNR